ncbi:REP-associated tyrosine transposase [Gayadomonas joobiniege]|uniref:REP-associated tyrosine transposase n=1 Tax=Gayadomonas joobiniege TaxID=1234606 RepID=UPI0004744DFF|nr:transposase [Gayadomonas joobiniege]
MRYRRLRIKGGTYFFTLAVSDRSTNLLTNNIQILRESWRRCLKKHPFTTVAVVIMPEHLHAIWELPENDYDYSTRWRLIKKHFSNLIGHPKLWQKRFWEHTIRYQIDLNNHINYIHFNPVKHGYVERAVDWPYSSIHKYIRDGVISKNWGTSDKSFAYLNDLSANE